MNPMKAASGSATKMKKNTVWSLAVAGVCLAFGVQAAFAAADADAGKKKFYACGGCHAIEGYGNAFPTYPVPRVGGQHAEAVIGALKSYLNGERKHGTMEGNAKSMSEQDMQDIAAYLSKLKDESAVGAVTGNAAAGKGKAAACGACHGEDGNSQIASNPRLAGQHEGYLIRALKDYQSGARKNPIMSGMAKDLSEQDIHDIAAYYASQKKGLSTVSD
jgi:cytochrome c553